MGKHLDWAKINNLPPLKISSGTMEVVKWVALISMTIDHANRFLFASSIQSLYCAGRLAMPLFAFIFAYNLAQPDVLSRGLHKRVLIRLIIFGIIATPGYIAMRHLQYLWPLNIMFMLAVATAVLYCFEIGGTRNRAFALLIFLLGGLLVEYTWVGIFFCLSSWFYCRKSTLMGLLAWLAAYLFLDNINGNNWALATLPLIFLATQINLKVPRIPYFFYYYYPLHLYILYLLSHWI
ncbi:TraX protein [Legionella drozanskii LLAP-1]|uniref:TraX protein n=2 Tax=Legionellaceae TaxID=444 RepID=A0A0W0SPN0_9GAMM|nr:TraX protein [Legionella drozanskii LLAP-1]PJE10116.1 MAG: conjugal transfer protein TraX [Legionella sp.]